MPSEIAEYVVEVLEEIADAIGVEAEVEINETSALISAEYTGPDAGSLIGPHGATLDAIQHLAHRIAFQGEDVRKPLVVDAAGYRARRASALHAIADQAAEAAVAEGRPVPLDPMGAQERKVVHEHLKGRFGIETFSEGQEPNRRLVVAPLVG